MSKFMKFPTIDPVFFRIGPVELRWYGLMYVLGFTIAYFGLLHGVKRKQVSLSKDDVADFIFYFALGVIIGGRLGSVLFYNFSYYLAHPLRVFAVWEGGMSFHGGLIGAALASFYFVRKKNQDFFLLADIAIMCAPIGLALGRIGNFINGELYGRVTDVPWGIVFPGGGDLPRHPSQLYEAVLEGPVTFFILWVLARKDRPTGVIFWSFITLYGLFRFFAEFLREPDVEVGLFLKVFSMGQLLSIPMILAGIMMIWVSYRRAD